MKILLLNNLISYTYNFRKEIIDALVAAGHEVVVVAENDDDKKLQELQKSCRFVNVPFNGTGTNVFEELSLLNTYKHIVREEKPDFVFTFTIKMNLYGGLASRKYHVPYVPMITGLGELEKEGKLRAVLLSLHRMVMPHAEAVLFQNQDNLDFFREHNIGYKKAVVLPGSGINLEKFAYREYPEGDVINFAFLGRIIKAKGVEEYFTAAEKLSSPGMIFHAAGPVNDEYKERVDDLVRRGKLVYDGVLSDSRDYLASSSCLVLPTFHPEGLSNAILEANAVGRPVICTARTGCKEIVSDGVNGFFCREKDSEDLERVIMKFASLPVSERAEMGMHGREIVERKFDRKIVVDAYLSLLEAE